ncbi:hypothetical protein SELMODRAFT_85188 [Selaginella moellendorffii]|uniref:Plastocyanin-like domain-containing protein n=1 Tax=Selaginella moellendorffii TaxID=88036 RepID=D8R6A7_SELML|nr:hypothetical protein SELMODRAFT_85188 [Selaginella moellendorffii]
MVSRLGRTKNIITVNGKLPGPTIYANNGDRLLITVPNTDKMSIHCHRHGIWQFRNPWFNGPAYVTQCPLKRGYRFTYVNSLLACTHHVALSYCLWSHWQLSMNAMKGIVDPKDCFSCKEILGGNSTR